MKKIVLFMLLSVVMFSSCANKEGTNTKVTSNTKTVDDVLKDRAAKATPSVVEEEKITEVVPPKLEIVEAKPVEVDIDLSKENATMVYSTVSNMLATPGDYFGQTVRIKGTHNAYENNGNIYHFCLVQDATACCSQGFEFTVENGKYPPLEEDTTIVGTFESYDENGMMYLRLANCTVE